jgi:hypothetical protein
MYLFVVSVFIVCNEPRKFMLVVWKGYGYGKSSSASVGISRI